MIDAEQAQKLAFDATVALVKDAKSRLGRAIDAVKNTAGGNAYDKLRHVTRLEGINAATKAGPSLGQASGRVLDIHKQIKAMPKLRSAALGLMREKRL